VTFDDLWGLLTRTEAPWWAIPAVTLLTALLTLWVTSRRDDRARNQQAAVEAVASVAAIAVHLAGLIQGRAEAVAERQRLFPTIQREDRSDKWRWAVQTATELEARQKELASEIAGLQKDFYQAQSVVNLLAPGAELKMVKLSAALDDLRAAETPDEDAVHRAADDFLAAARTALKIRGGGRRATIPGSSPAEERSRSTAT
jgi:hypothetical protein